jgi:hypothetical protein
MRRIAPLIVGIALMAGCGEPVATDVTAGIQPPQVTADKGVGSGEAGLSASVRSDLALLRRVTAKFHEFDEASEAGWSAQITPCMTDPGGAGGMGFHYGNVGLINGSASVDKPQLLLYEPEKNGRLRLVAVEYIIPYTFVPRSAEPPVLFNQKFAQVDAFQLWGLHAWVWKENPSGMFASWNPTVNCAHTNQVMVMSHN